MSEVHAWTRFDTQKLNDPSPLDVFKTCTTQDQAAEMYSTAELFLGLFGRELAVRVERQEICVVLTTPGF